MVKGERQSRGGGSKYNNSVSSVSSIDRVNSPIRLEYKAFRRGAARLSGTGSCTAYNYRVPKDV
jgi:hypothetical protein